MKEKFNSIPKEQRKKILLICDDIRAHSGVGTIAKEIVLNTCHHFNFVNLAGGINHPEAGKKLDLSQHFSDTSKEDSSVMIYPNNGYGDANLLRQLLAIEKPDAIMIITDPRYFEWLFQIENEIRKTTPIIYLNIWDNFPTPLYNRSYYESCDALLAISKQTKLINELVLGEKTEGKIIEYIPHGLNEEIFKPLSDNNSDLISIKNKLFNGEERDFVLLFNSRNIRRKQIPDTLLAFKYFLDDLPKEKANKCSLILHTQPHDENGTDLYAVRDLLFKDYPNAIIFSTNKYSQEVLNCLYNIADAQILLSSNEGWGLTLTEAMLAGTPIIANVTGGMQDQMRFADEENSWVNPTPQVPSNHTKHYPNKGEWAFPVFPTNRSIQGSIKTPYIWDDRCEPMDAAKQIEKVYKLSRQQRKEVGLEGREFALNEGGFTGKIMGERVINAIDKLFNTWSPRSKYELINCNDIVEPELNHELNY
jgi:glycosyltransferase involved in cell wall biosynthesis